MEKPNFNKVESEDSRDFNIEKAFNAAQYPFFFQIFLRICFLEIEVRFFGTAIENGLFIVLVGCERHLLVKRIFVSYSLSMYLYYRRYPLYAIFQI